MSPDHLGGEAAIRSLDKPVPVIMGGTDARDVNGQRCAKLACGLSEALPSLDKLFEECHACEEIKAIALSISLSPTV